MRPLRYSINITLDGCCDRRAMIADEELHRHAAESLAQAGALVFGRVTYEMMEAAWRPVARTAARPDWMADWMEPFARAIDAAKKYVVSSTLTQVDWNAELVRGDHLETKVRRLKQQPGKGLLVGGVKLPLALAELGLIDEYEFIVHPRLAGHGPTLFAGLSKSIDLKLVGQRAIDSGARERKFLTLLEALPLPQTREFVLNNIQSGNPQFVALAKGEVVGWCDIRRHFFPAHAHRGTLGMGIVRAYRGCGLGTRLINATLEAAFGAGFVRVELDVHADNARAISLYGRVG